MGRVATLPTDTLGNWHLTPTDTLGENPGKSSSYPGPVPWDMQALFTRGDGHSVAITAVIEEDLEGCRTGTDTLGD